MGMLIDTNIEEKLRDEWSVNLHRIIHFCYKLVFQTRTKWVWGFFLMRGNEKKYELERHDWEDNMVFIINGN